MHRYSYRNNLLGIGIICTDIGLICGSTGIMSTDIELICTGIGKICEGVGIMCTVLGKPLAQNCISNFSAGTNRGLTETDGGAGEGSRETCFITVGDVYPHFHPQLPSHSPTHPHIGAPHFLGVDLLWLFIIQAIPKTPILFDLFILPLGTTPDKMFKL